MAEERLKLAVFIDFDNIQIGVKDTLKKDFDVSIVLEALKERGEVVSKTAYGDWPRAGEHSRQMSQHAVQMVQRNVTPRGDKNGADINLALDALEMAFTRNHINTFVIVGGDSDFIALVEKLKQYDKRVFVVGGRQFTSGILQRNCHEFIAYENLLKTPGDGSRSPRSARASGRAIAESRPLATAWPNIQRALKVLAEREVAPQVGLLKSTLLQLDPTFSERDYGTGSFLEFIQKLEKAGMVYLRKTERGYLVEAREAEGVKEPVGAPPEPAGEAPSQTPQGEASATAQGLGEEAPASEASPEVSAGAPDAIALLRQAIIVQAGKAPSRPLYMRQVRQMMRAQDRRFDERASGFRNLLDLLHQAQREGWVRLHRDRNGIWRIFPVLSAPVAAEVVPQAVGEAPIPAEVEPASTGIEAGIPEPSLIEAPQPAPPEALQSPSELTAPSEAAAKRKPRKARGTARKAGRHKGAARTSD